MKFTMFVPCMSSEAIQALLSPLLRHVAVGALLVSLARTVCGTLVLNACR